MGVDSHPCAPGAVFESCSTVVKVVCQCTRRLYGDFVRVSHGSMIVECLSVVMPASQQKSVCNILSVLARPSRVGCILQNYAPSVY